MRLPKHPRDLAYRFWPDGFSRVDGHPVWFYDRQWDMVESVWRNDETIVVAGNMLGKDFVAGFICLAYFLLHHGPTVRVVTTSVAEHHLKVLWGEIGRFIQTCKYPLEIERGGPLVINHQHIRKVVNGRVCPVSHLVGLVSKKGEGMAGHHADHTLLCVDEASASEPEVKEQAQGWMQKLLAFGNPNPCSNWWKDAVDGGDLHYEDSNQRGRLHRKVIRIRAEDSPNVRHALAEKRMGKQPSNRVLVPGVLKYEDGIKGYVYRRKYWDKVRQAIGLDARFWKGAELLLYPPDWLDRAERVADNLRSKVGRKAKGMGVDPGEGEADTSWSVVDDFGLMYQVWMQTPDTSVINPMTYELMRQFGLSGEQVCYDRGGGGRQLAQAFNESHGIEVRTVSFGEAIMLDLRQGLLLTVERQENREERTTYRNRRAQMYGAVNELLDPTLNEDGFGIPAEYTELRRQMALIPKTRDKEGTLYILPKQKRDPSSKEKTLTELLGRSPDQLDSLVLAVYAMQHEEHQAVAGAL